MAIFSKLQDRYSLACLNGAQFFGVLNDNVFKLVMIFLMIEVQGYQSAPKILSAAGATFVLPFLLFSSSAGILADRFSKQRLLVLMKIAEITIMLLAIFAFAFKSVWGSFTLLFLLAAHSAAFGPSKYGIIPELVPSEKVSKANGLVTGFTYLAIILGTFLASFITDITDRGFISAAVFCLAVAVAGFLCALGIKKTSPQGSTKKINVLFLREIYQTLVFCNGRNHLLLAIFGASYFLFIGAFTQLNIIPFAIESLHLTEVAGGYLFLSTALGIALGSFLAGKASRKRIELGLACISGFFIAIFLFLLSVFPTHLISVTAFLVLLGGFGGAFIVPFDTYIQVHSPDEKRGQVIAASNFLGFFGVLIASIALYLFSEVFDISSSSGFAIIGAITLGFAIYLALRLSDLSIAYFSRKLLRPFYRLQSTHLDLYEKNPVTLLILENATWLKVLLLLSFAPNAYVLVPKEKKRRFPYFRRIFSSIRIVPPEEDLPGILESAKPYLDKDFAACIFVRKTMPREAFETGLFKRSIPHLFVQIDIPARTITFSKE